MSSLTLERCLPEWLHPAPDSLVGQARRCGERGGWQFLSLLWSMWLFVAPLFTDVGSSFFWSLAIGYPLFLLLYTLLLVRSQREAEWYVAGLVLLAMVSLPWNPSAWTYSVFACAFVPYRGSLLYSTVMIVLIQLVVGLQSILLGFPWWVIFMMVAVSVSSGFGALFGRVSWRRNAELRMSQDEVRRLAATSERERIGRDLHDLLGHTLSLITLKLELSRKLLDRDPDAARRELAEAEKVARHALSEVRSAVTGIRAAGLAGELAAAKLLLHGSGVDFEYQLPELQLADTTERELALVLREAVTNIHRHAGASRARVELESDGGLLRMRVEDNGRGGVDRHGNGLAGIGERVAGLAGSLAIESPHKHGTRLLIEVPREPQPVTGVAGEPGNSAAAGRVPASRIRAMPGAGA